MESTTKRTFYSKSRGLMICANSGEMIMVGGEMKRVGEKHIQFRPIGDYGIYETSDPELIAYLDERTEKVADVFGPEKYQKLIVPADMQVEALERQLADANRLIARLKQQPKGSPVAA